MQHVSIEYIRSYNPSYRLIEGQEGGQYSPGYIQNMFLTQIEKAAVDSYASV
ncbi:MAG: hypothetical protein IPQ10_08190 [Saprospiraceae bacterium]|nr:hypothetical protein [Saprospiraceae bacterium]MBK7795918.1 hypothetical protein [Saprospiraceae bacterium]MBK9379270.1 hypothetical protein [Saprospiraceae bacterium]MBL0261031.1 hypothetical protein [Saprospiraceae bacterium]